MEQNEKIVSPMSNEGRNAYVVEQLTGALLALLQEKPLADISVSQLCDKAGVGRTSFYRNYQEKEDILRARIYHLFKGWTCLLGEGAPLDQLILAMFTHFEEHRDFYALLNEEYTSGFHLIDAEQLSMEGYDTDVQGGTKEYHAIACEDFTVESDVDWITAEADQLCTNLYLLQIHVDSNPGLTERTGHVFVKSRHGESLYTNTTRQRGNGQRIYIEQESLPSLQALAGTSSRTQRSAPQACLPLPPKGRGYRYKVRCPCRKQPSEASSGSSGELLPRARSR